MALLPEQKPDTKLFYEKPTITKLNHGYLINKYGSEPHYARKIRTTIDDVPIAELVHKYGSPLFVFSENTIRNKIQEAKECFTARYPNVTFGWSYKTNYLDAICAIFHKEGCVAEVVSEMEYQKARNLGVSGENIIFNGPNKSLAILKQAVAEGAKIHIDHFDEIEDLEKIAKALKKPIKVGLRLSLDAGIYPQWTRFGFNLESGQALDAARRIKMGDKLDLVGLHSHIGTFIIDPEAYRVQIEKMVQFAYQLEKELGQKINYFDIGGGFPSKSKLKGTYFPPEHTIMPMESYAEKITDGLYKNLKSSEFPHVYIESGRALIDEAGYLITTVCTSKRLPDGSKSYVLDAGVNLLYTSTWYKFTIEMDRAVQGVGEPSLLNGPLCMNIDVVDESAMLPPLARGTRLILSPVGAYNITQSMQFIEYRPAVVLITSAGKAEVIRERESLADLISKEKLPAYLKLNK